MKIERSGFNLKKHFIHILVAGAMAISWGAVSHVNSYMHSHVTVSKSSKPGKSRRSKSQFAPDTASPMEQTGPTPVVPMATASTPTPTTDSAPAPAPTMKTQAKAKASPVSLITVVAAKVGVTITEDKDVSITQSKVDADFIRKVEGSVLKGYVPLPGKTKSGVTIADGFDLGQMHASEFNKLPIDAALKAKLLPYIGLTRYKAVNFLKAHPLTITNDELKQLNIIAANKILKPLVTAYNKASGKSFLDLPAQAQTAIFSYAYQYGSGFMYKARAKQLWHSFITQNWQKASSVLRSSKMYASRRAQEAQLLDHI